MEPQKFEKEQEQKPETFQFAPAQITNKSDGTAEEQPMRHHIQQKPLSTTFNLFVGKIQDGIATLLSDDFNLIEIPMNVLPSDLRKGNILKITIERNIAEEERRRNEIVFLQKMLLEDENLFLKGATSN